ncbi:MAG: zinc ribbon domain-containing protein, partial [Bacillota bacterium]|nr:zinc ribbon domain-containing protein [Bacillota bacterium]
FNGAMGNFSSLLSSIGTIAGTLILIIIVVWLIGSAFYTGLFNLTAKSYHEKTTFKDFRFAGFLRFLSWQGFLLIIQLILLTIGLIGAVTLRSSQGALISFFIVYGLMIVGITIFALPWLSTSAIYLLAHPNDRFRTALSGSWRFFRKNTGALWGYIGTVILIEIAFQVLNRISPGIAGLATLVVSPFIAILAIVWVLSLEEDELNKNIVRSEIDTPPPYSTVPFPEAQANPANSPTPDPLRTTLPTPEHPLPEVPPLKSEEPKINLQKHNQPEPMNQLPEDNPNFCPSCGRANTGTAYCPQCGTKLH